MDQIRYSFLGPVIWHPTALAELRKCSKEIRDEFGYLIFLLQKGSKLSMPYSRPMPEVAPGVHELRARGQDGIYRIFYYCRFKNEVLILHLFKKKTQKTPDKELKRAMKNLRELL